MDITDAEAVAQVIGAEKPDYIINTAAMTNVDQCETEREKCRQVNVHAVANLIAAAADHNSFLLHLSTDFIFSGEYGPLAEDASPAPVNYYGESKLEAERLLQQSSINWAIARTALVYGITPNMSRSNIILWVKNSLEGSKSINVVDDQFRTPTLAEDLAMGCWLIVKHRAKGIFHISDQDIYTPYDMALQTARHFQLDLSLINRTDASAFSQPAKRPPKTGFIIEKAKKELGYQPHSLAQGLALMERQLKEFSS
jgi:dTDP-4-dehydrorhamnose reductase